MFKHERELNTAVSTLGAISKFNRGSLIVRGTARSDFDRDACSPGADVTAVWFRASMLGVLQMFPESPLIQWTHDGELDDVVF
jgi:hypothetical protein